MFSKVLVANRGEIAIRAMRAAFEVGARTVAVFPHEDRCCACSSCGVCKQAPIKDAKYAGRTTVLVGDGTSDYKAALLADIVFAKSTLAAWCARSGVDFVPYSTLRDVLDALVPTP